MVDAIMLPSSAWPLIASRNCELEHKGHTLKLLGDCRHAAVGFTGPSWPGAPWCWPACCCARCSSVWPWACRGLPGGTPWGRFVVFTALSWAVSMTLYALQQGLSLRFANQAVALVCGIFGSFCGTLCPVFPRVGPAGASPGGTTACLSWWG
ncbi:MAG: hypothetical protein ACLT9P_10120 [Evtepia gabavorous]